MPTGKYERNHVKTKSIITSIVTKKNRFILYHQQSCQYRNSIQKFGHMNLLNQHKINIIFCFSSHPETNSTDYYSVQMVKSKDFIGQY